MYRSWWSYKNAVSSATSWDDRMGQWWSASCEREEKPEDTPLPAASLVTTQFFPLWSRGGGGIQLPHSSGKGKKNTEDELEQNLPKLVHPGDRLRASPNCSYFNTRQFFRYVSKTPVFHVWYINDTEQQQSPSFLAPGTGFVKRVSPWTRGWGMVSGWF